MRLLLSVATVLAAVTGLALPATAMANRSQLTMLEDTAQVLNSGPDVRGATLDEFKGLGARIVKLRVDWDKIAPRPSSEVKPAFDATDPAAYPPGAWDRLDAAVRDVTARGLQVFLMLGPPAPEWATRPGERRGHPGVFKPDPAEFEKFVTAVGRRYPQVHMWSVWNEPNHPQFLQPLSERLGGKVTPSSPHLYRRLYVAAQGALERTGHGLSTDTVLFGEILPIGQGRLGATNTIRPLLFLREFFCLDPQYKRLRGRAAGVRGCNPFPLIKTSGFAYHPYTKPEGPRVALASPDDATIGQIQRVERALDLIAKTKRLRRGLAIYNTEFGLQTDPPDCVGFGTSLANQAAFINEAEYVSFTRRRVKTYSNYLLVDDPILTFLPPGTNSRYGGFQTGLKFGANATRCESPSVKLPYGSPKRPSYDAFRTPIYVRQVKPNRVQVFGAARPRTGFPQTIEILKGGAVVRTVSTSGYFLVNLNQAAVGTWQLRWSFGGLTFLSRKARALKDPLPDPALAPVPVRR